MSHKLSAAIENHPTLGWLASAFSLFTSWLAWSVQHADDLAKVFGLCAAIFGVVAGYYTMRIQRRAWKQGQGK